MSDREKRLVFLLLGAVFVVVNLGVYKKVYEVRVKAADTRLADAKVALMTAETDIANKEAYAADMKWLARYEPKPSSAQQAQTKLEQLVKNYAKSQKLTVKGTKLPTSITDPDLNYHRVRVQIDLNGSESQLYPFLARVHSPNEFRAVTLMKVYPQKNEPTMADCQVMVEQWFLPADSQ